jgi:Putative beta barrel porin-7 (BBP7)
MKRLLLGLGCVLGLTPGGLFSQDTTPAARLGQPAATLGRPVQDPVTIRAQSPGDNTPKPMPKGAVSETPKVDAPMLPMPAPATGGPTIVLPPGHTVVPPGLTESMISGPMFGPPIPGGPVLDSGEPFGVCPVPGGNTCGWYTSVEALVWWVKSYSAPALVSVGPAFSGANLAVTGTTALYGVSPVDTNPRYGARIGLGYWLSPHWAVELSAFYLRPESNTFSAHSAMFPEQDLARPFFSLNRGVETSQIVGRPGVASGSVLIDSESEFYGAELNCRWRKWDGCWGHLDFIAGVRYLYLRERLVIQEDVTGLVGAGSAAGISRSLVDSFETQNRFYGAQVGAIFTKCHGPWTIDVTAKVAAGINRQSAEITGTLAPLSPGTLPGRPGALLALESNIGLQKRETFAVVPEVALNVGYDVTSRLRVFAGASFLYWSSVARPGAQIDRTLDENLIPDFPPAPPAGAIRPLNTVKSESFWATGFNVGILFRW